MPIRLRLGIFYDDHGSGLLLGNLTIEFGSLMGVISSTREYKGWSMHRGLILGILDLYTYLVYNPATKEAFILPRSVSQASLNRGSSLVAIINLSDCPLSTECNFKVVRFVKAISMTKGMVFVEVYSSNKCEWCVSKFRLKKAVIEEKWHVCTGVFVNNTLFFLTNKRHAVGVQFHSSGQVRRVYSLRLPRRIAKGFCESGLDGSQGSLYLSYHKFPNLWIWKHTGSSTDADAWIPQLIFKKSGISLCKPVVENFLRQSVADYSDTHPMIIHPQAPVVYISVYRSIFACHLLNDTVEKIVELNESEVALLGCVFMYSPCFASLNCLKAEN